MSQPLQAVLAVLIGAALVVVLTELQKRWWSRGYFGLRALLTGFEYEDQPTVAAVLARAAIPLSAGAATALLAPAELPVAAALAASAGTLAIAWPVFLSMEGIPAELYGREVELRLLHVMYVATAAVLGFAGGLLVVVANTIGGEGLIELGSDVLRDLAVEIVGAVLLLALGVFGLRVQARRSGEIRDEAMDESDQRTGRIDGR